MIKPEKDSLGDRMKSYEQKHNLPSNIPVIIRIDGRAFHTLTRGMKKPFDLDFINMMDMIGKELCKEIQGPFPAKYAADPPPAVPQERLHPGGQVQ